MEGGIGVLHQVGVKEVQDKVGIREGKDGAKSLRDGVSHPLGLVGAKEVLLPILPGAMEEVDHGDKVLRLAEEVMGDHGTRALTM